MIGEQFQALLSGLGTNEDLQAMDQTLTGAVLSLIRDRADPSELDQLRNEVGRLESLLQALDDEVGETQDRAAQGITDGVRLCGQKISTVVQRVVTLEGRGSQVPGSGGGGPPPPGPGISQGPGAPHPTPGFGGGGGGGGPPPSLVAAVSGGTIPIDTMMIETDGSHVMTLRDLLLLVRGIESRTGTLEADVHAQGGITFDNQNYASEAKILVLLNAELGSVSNLEDVAACFVDAASWFIHDDEHGPIEAWKADTKELEKSGFGEEMRKLAVTFVVHRQQEGRSGEAHGGVRHYRGLGRRGGPEGRAGAYCRRHPDVGHSP